MQDFPVFTGNCPRNVAKDAKYAVRYDKRTKALGIGLTYRTDDDAIWHMTTVEHPELVEMVNAVKNAYGNGINGAFYINEHKQVIVPVVEDGLYYLAGKYDKLLEFHFKGKTISGQPIRLDGSRMEPGDRWTGPHAGIPYVLTATGDDVYYRTRPEPEIERRVKLSAKRGRPVAAKMARLLSALKGPGGGRIYVNEFGSVFSRLENEEGWEYVYFGQLDLTSWFPEEGPGALVLA